MIDGFQIRRLFNPDIIFFYFDTFAVIDDCGRFFL